jgi:hypothetical protein
MLEGRDRNPTTTVSMPYLRIISDGKVKKALIKGFTVKSPAYISRNAPSIIRYLQRAGKASMNESPTQPATRAKKRPAYARLPCNNPRTTCVTHTSMINGEKRKSGPPPAGQRERERKGASWFSLLMLQRRGGGHCRIRIRGKQFNTSNSHLHRVLLFLLSFYGFGGGGGGGLGAFFLAWDSLYIIYIKRLP